MSLIDDIITYSELFGPSGKRTALSGSLRAT